MDGQYACMSDDDLNIILMIAHSKQCFITSQLTKSTGAAD